MKTLTESSGQLTARGQAGARFPRNHRADIEQKTEVSSIADRSLSGSGRAFAVLGRPSPMRWDDIVTSQGLHEMRSWKGGGGDWGSSNGGATTRRPAGRSQSIDHPAAGE